MAWKPQRKTTGRLWHTHSSYLEQNQLHGNQFGLHIVVFQSLLEHLPKLRQRKLLFIATIRSRILVWGGGRLPSCQTATARKPCVAFLPHLFPARPRSRLDEARVFPRGPRRSVLATSRRHLSDMMVTPIRRPSCLTRYRVRYKKDTPTCDIASALFEAACKASRNTNNAALMLGALELRLG